MEKILHIDPGDNKVSADEIDMRDRAAELLSLKTGALAPVFWPPSRTDVDSAWYAHVPFGHWIISRIRPRLAVELGTHNGVSYAAFCEAVARLHLPTACFAVDTWKGDEHAGFYGEEIYEDLAEFNSARYGSFSELLRCSFDEAALYFADQSIDFLHIDGLHTYEAVKHDFETWLPKLSQNAVVLVHDTNVREQDFGVWRVFLELKQRYPTFEFLHGHGLGVVAVGTEPPPAVASLCTLDEDSISLIRECFATMGKHFETDPAGEPAPSQAGNRLYGQSRAMRSLSASIQEANARSDGLEAALHQAFSRIESLEVSAGEANGRTGRLELAVQQVFSRVEALEASTGEANSRTDRLEAALQQAFSRVEALEASTGEANSRSNGLDDALREAFSRIEESANEIAALKAELHAAKKGFVENLGKRVARIASWKNYDAAYQEWKMYKKGRLDKRQALEGVNSLYGVYPFFFFYPLYKIVKPVTKCKRALEHILPRSTTVLPGQPDPEGESVSSSPGGDDATDQPQTNGPISQPPDFSPRGLRVVYISGEPDTPGHVYRVVRHVESLSAAGIQITWIRLDELENRLAEITGAALLVIWRAPHCEVVQQAIEIAHCSGARVLFDVDDLMIDPAFAQVEIIDGIRSMNLTEQEVESFYARIQQTMVLADFCSAPTEELAAQIRRWQIPALVLPNGYGQTTYDTSRLAVRKRRAAVSDGLVRIGYATGSRTHQTDFAVAADAVARILRESAHCRLVLFQDAGGGPVLIPEEFPQLTELSAQIEWRTLVPVEKLPEELARFDINLAPLAAGNPFCEAKSELKYFEAALVEVPTIASPTGPFRRAIRNGMTGFLPTQPSEWYDALRHLVDDPELRRRVGKAAYRDVIWPYGPLRRAQMLHAALHQWCGDARLAALLFELELHRTKSKDAQKPFIIPESEIAFEYDQLDQAEVTVVVPLYNYAHYVEEALDSVLNQSLNKLDLIVVDDKSTDDSLNVALMWAKEHKQRFNRLLVMANKSNSGLGPTRNAGFDAADTSFILPLDADNRLKPNCCEVCLNTIKETGAAFVYPVIQTFGDDCKIMGDDEFFPARLIGGNYIDAMSLISREAWAAAGGYGHFQVLGWEDFEFWCRLVELGLGGSKAGGDPLAEYRIHCHSMLQKITTLPHNRKQLVVDMKTCHPWLNLV